MTLTTSQRGYGTTHSQLIAYWTPIVNRGEAWCRQPTCLMRTRWIPPGTPWDLGHDHVNGGYLGPTHRRCNRADGARRGNKRRAKRRAITARRW